MIRTLCREPHSDDAVGDVAQVEIEAVLLEAALLLADLGADHVR